MPIGKAKPPSCGMTWPGGRNRCIESSDFRLCEGFRIPAQRVSVPLGSEGRRPKAFRKENRAGETQGVPRASWGFECSTVEDQPRHQARERCPRLRRQLRPCGRAGGVVRQAAPEQIYLMLRAQSSIVPLSFARVSRHA